MAEALQRAIFLELYPTIAKIRYAELASTMIILFDHLLTLDQEVRLIWSAQLSLGKILFLINRYYALCVVVFNNYVLFNTTELSRSGWTGVITFIIAELILQLRLYALYFRNKRVLAVTNIVCLAAAVGSSYVMGHALSRIVAFSIQLPNTGSTVCVPIGLPSGFYQFWIPMLVSECVLCGLALYRGFRSYRPAENILQSGRRIIEILVRDSVWYFVVIFATYLTNAIIFLTRGGAEVEIPIGFAVALSTVMSSRLCLNVRGYIRDESMSDTLPGPASAVYSPRAGNTRNAFVSFPGEEYDGGADGEGDGDGDGDDGKGQTDSTRSNPVSKVVQSGAALGEVEMRELRSMRAESPGPRSILRMPFSIGRRSPCLDEVIHIQ